MLDNISFCVIDCGVQEEIMSNKIEKNKTFKRGLYIIATPIGNLDDISKRAVKILTESNIIICENPNHSIKLLNNIGIKKKLLAMHDYNEEQIINKIKKHQHNSVISLITDAGSPLISDPGYKLVRYYIKEKIFVTSVPGPSSVISALQLSGIGSNSFKFYGFVPKTKQKIDNFLTQLKQDDAASVFFISGKNLKTLLNEFLLHFEKRQIAICKELTKINETIVRGTGREVCDLLSNESFSFKGEFTIVISSPETRIIKSIDYETMEEIKKLLKKYSLTEAVRIVHNLTQISRKEIYNTAIKLKNE